MNITKNINITNFFVNSNINFEHEQVVIPIAVGLSAVLASFIILKLYFSDRAKKLLKNPELKYSVTLMEKLALSHDTRLFRFALPSEDYILGLPVGQHIELLATVDDQLLVRPYTPVSGSDDKGYMDLIVKVYFKNVHPKFPFGGKMSQYLERMKIGDKIDIKGPSGNLVYAGRGLFFIRPDNTSTPQKFRVDYVGMIAGGTGITPMLQIIRQVFKDPRDTTDLSLIFANQSEYDILLQPELDEIAKAHPAQFKLWYTVDRPSKDWKYSTGYITDDMILEHLPPASEDILILLCGPPPMVKYACIPNLDKLGYNEQMTFVY